MKKTAAEMVEDILGQQAMDRKRKERWIAALTSGAIGTAAGLATKNVKWTGLPGEVVGAGMGGLLAAELPRAIWKEPIENADHPRWWRQDYSPTEHGLALGVGSGIGGVGGHLLLKALRSKGMLVPDAARPFKGLGGTIATMAIPSIAGLLGARKLMEMRDAKRDANG
jgi:hypothetical protein